MSKNYKEQMNVYEIAFRTIETAFTFIKALQTTTTSASASSGPLWFSAGKTSAFTITFLSAGTYPGRSAVRTP